MDLYFRAVDKAKPKELDSQVPHKEIPNDSIFFHIYIYIYISFLYSFFGFFFLSCGFLFVFVHGLSLCNHSSKISVGFFYIFLSIYYYIFFIIMYLLPLL